MNDQKKKDEPAKELQAKKTALGVVAALRSSGTPEATIFTLNAWLDANKNATPEALYAHMVTIDVNVGTLRKAGKEIHGDEFEPENADQIAAADEIAALKRENRVLKEQLAQSNNDKLAAVRGRAVALEREREALRKVNILRGGKTHEELAELGVTETVLA